MKKLLGAVVLAMGLGACGGTDNVKACEDYKAALSCGSQDLSTIKNALDCKIYDNTSCDISEYFTCLADNAKCMNDMLDVSGQTMCASKATCN